MLTVNGGLRIHLTRPLADAIRTTREVILLPDGAPNPARKYLDWHRQRTSSSRESAPGGAARADGTGHAELSAL